MAVGRLPGRLRRAIKAGMKIRFMVLFGLPLVLAAAINPANFSQIASEQLKLREVSRIVHLSRVDGDKWRRVTIVAEVVEVRRGIDTLKGEVVVVDYTVNLDARERAARDHAQAQGDRPGRQFMGEPEPPVVDEKGLFWASLAPVGGRLGNVNRHAGAVVGIGDYAVKGRVFVPVAGQYSFSAMW